MDVLYVNPQEMEITIKSGTTVFNLRANNALPSFPNYRKDSQNWDGESSELCTPS